MSKLGVGLYSLAGVYGKKDPIEIERMLLQAVEWGVDFFDVADQYGPAEEVLGATLHTFRSQIRISTKVGVTSAGGRDCSRKHIFASCKKSLKRLQTDYIDYYQIHFDDPETPVEETVAALEDLKKEGLVREYNIGHLPMNRVKEYVEIGNPRAIMIELSPVAWKQYRNLRPFCKEHELQILAMGTSGRGLMSGKIKASIGFDDGDIRRIDPLFQRSMLQSALRMLAKLQEIGNIYQKTPIQVALNWVAQLPQVEVVLTGPSTLAHLKENLGALGWLMEAEHRRVIESMVEAEEVTQREGQMHDLEKILMNELATDPTQVVADLVYVISGFIELEIADEKEFLPLFQDLMLWRKCARDRNIVEEMKRKLSEYLKL